ncbi:histidine kinase [Halorhabdus utahensis DSM 12940]|uniref:Histidine kinase n=1 Tax=Halorhabdus utahensis (strain DSM 12940 / JCM 11049 / AX-2) TaxID=519442 RepID=C7NVJ5_HALUD|nr:HAMP domain-containing sensor histidine kinase [Halorhabdus utahensis]ACV12518.1 histidine kinase [Halorhabdus utahensis DSM 12940]
MPRTEDSEADSQPQTGDTGENGTAETPILVLVSDPGNRTVLEDWLAGHETYRAVGRGADIRTADFECCLLDGEALQEHREALLDRQASEGAILPYLLLVPDVAHGEVRAQLEGEYPDLWAAIDGMVDMPVSEDRLAERVETVLRLREQSIAVNQQRDQLDVLNRVLRHDIRNDVHVILAWAENLEGELPAEKEQSIEKILRAGNHVVELTTSAHDIAEMIHGEGTPDLSAVSLDRVLRDELEKRRQTHPEADISMPEPASPETRVLANEMLSSVFRNLVNNAIQHNDADRPSVTVTVEDGDDVVRVTVADNGPGIPEAHRDRLFDEGERGMDSEGTGMGLFLVGRLVESHGGDVWIADRSTSADDGGTDAKRGVVFVVELPNAPAAD